MQNNRQKPIMISLVAALVACLVAFVIGFSMSSFVLLDSRLEDAQEKISELNEKIGEKNDEIKALNASIDEKNQNNVILAENLQNVAAENDSLKKEVESLRQDVTNISEAAINGSMTARGSLFDAISSLSITQQLIVFVILLVVLVLIVSVSCSWIASKSSGKGFVKKITRTRREKAEVLDEAFSQDEHSNEYIEEYAKEDAYEDSFKDEPYEEPVMEEYTSHGEPLPDFVSIPDSVKSAIDLLFHNNLEDNISALNGFKFGITNFDEVLSDKSRGKAFGNSENGDFVAFMSTVSSVRKLYIIPRYLTLSDSTVALRGTIDLFNVSDEAGNSITQGTVRIKSIDAPAVFSCGENGWGIESKGHITSLGDRFF